jgi:outer membrane PBP1 activator LpoA protein
MRRLSFARRSFARLLPLCALALLATACGDDDPATPNTPPAGVVPDFMLTDANPNSSLYAQTVSPRDYQNKVSAWYFGHST